MSKTIPILLAEDHMLVREGLKLLLSMEPGWQVVAETGNGLEVEALVRAHRPALLVLDLDLPGKHGVDITATLRADPAHASLAILVLTGNLKPQPVGRALAAGANGYVLKSEDSGELLAGVRAVLDGGSFVSPQIAHAFHAAPPAQADPLTPREREILSLIARGYANPGIAEVLSISVLTVRTHRQKLMDKLGLRNAAEITAYAVKHGFYDPA